MRTILVLLAISLAATVAFGDEVTTLLRDADGDPKAAESAVRIALNSPEPATRAFAARVANAKGMTALLPNVTMLVDRESDVNAAREEIRAMLMLGDAKSIDRAAYANDRLGKRLDAEVANAAAHLGPSSFDAYFTWMKDRNIDRADYFRVALWGHERDAPALAARLIREDPQGMNTLLMVLGDEPRFLLDDATLIAALNSSGESVRASTMWYIASEAVKQAVAVSPALHDLIGTLRVPRDDADQIAAVEIARRAVGYPRRNFPEFAVALANPISQVRIYLGPAKLLTLLNDTERRVATDLLGEDDAAAVDPPAIVLPAAVPPGLTQQVMTMTGCNAGWFGSASVTVNERGFVVSRDLTKVVTNDACRKALDMLLQYSIADVRLVTGGRRSDAVSLVRAANGPMCFDEATVTSTVARRFFNYSAWRMPRVREEAPPVWPSGVPKNPVDVGVEVMVSAQGCVRYARVIKPAPQQAVNDAALVAAQQWKFQPGTMNTSPIDMLYAVTIEFR